MSIFNTIQKFASAQHGVVARYQLLEDCVGANSIKSALRSGALSAVANGIYVTVGSQNTWEQRAAIATLSCRDEGYLSHESTLVIFGLLPKERNRISRRRMDRTRNQLIHVTTPRHMYIMKNVYFHRSTQISAYDKSLTSYGIRHMSIERSIIDAAQQLADYELEYVIDNALSQGLIQTKRIKTQLHQLHTAPGREKNRTLASLEPYLCNYSNSESALEKRVEKVIVKLTSRKIVRQHNIQIRGQRYRIDLAIPSLKIAIEVDGFEFHRSRTKFDDDRRRQNDLISVGWKLVRITAVFSDEEIRQAIIALLAT